MAIRGRSGGFAAARQARALSGHSNVLDPMVQASLTTLDLAPPPTPALVRLPTFAEQVRHAHWWLARRHVGDAVGLARLDAARDQLLHAVDRAHGSSA